jgi:hypothetical protein
VQSDEVLYDNLAPWPDVAGTAGASLHRTAATAPGISAASWRAAAASPGSVQFSSTAAGDFDGDGDVDGSDFLAWQRGLGISSGATRTQGDADADGDVDGQDLAAWRGSFGAAGQESAAAGDAEESISMPSAPLSPIKNVESPRHKFQQRASRVDGSWLRSAAHFNRVLDVCHWRLASAEAGNRSMIRTAETPVAHELEFELTLDAMFGQW